MYHVRHINIACLIGVVATVASTACTPASVPTRHPTPQLAQDVEGRHHSDPDSASNEEVISFVDDQGAGPTDEVRAAPKRKAIPRFTLFGEAHHNTPLVAPASGLDEGIQDSEEHLSLRPPRHRRRMGCGMLSSDFFRRSFVPEMVRMARGVNRPTGRGIDAWLDLHGQMPGRSPEVGSTGVSNELFTELVKSNWLIRSNTVPSCRRAWPHNLDQRSTRRVRSHTRGRSTRRTQNNRRQRC